MNMKKHKTTIRRILSSIGRYKWGVLASLACALITVVLTLYVPILTGKAIDCILAPGSVDFAVMGRILTKIGVIILITAVSQWLMSHINNIITYRVVKDIRVRAFAKVERLPLKYIDSHSHGDIISRLIADIDQFSDGLLMGFTQLFTGILTILGTLIFMFTINPAIAVVVIWLPRSLCLWQALLQSGLTPCSGNSRRRGANSPPLWKKCSAARRWF